MEDNLDITGESIKEFEAATALNAGTGLKLFIQDPFPGFFCKSKGV